MNPLAPFHDWPLQHRTEGLGFAWYTAPATLIDQPLLARGHVRAATWVHDLIDEVLRREAEDVRAHGGLLVVHDWRAVEGFDAEARRVFLDRMRQREPGHVRGAVAIVRDTPLFRMVVQTGNLVMAMRTGAKLEMATDPVETMRLHRVQRPTRAGWR